MNIILFIIACICINAGIAVILNVISWTKDALNKKMLIIGWALAVIGMVCWIMSMGNTSF